MDAQTFAKVIARKAQDHPTAPIRFEGGQGEPYSVSVAQRSMREDDKEIVVYTRNH